MGISRAASAMRAFCSALSPVVPITMPTCKCRHPENVLLGEIVARFEFVADQIFGIFAQVVVVLWTSEICLEFGAALHEGVGHVLEEYKAEHDVLVYGGVEHG